MPMPETDRHDRALSPNVLVSAGVLNPLAEFTEMRFADGEVVRVPTSLLRSDTRQVSALRDTEPYAEQAQGAIVVPIVEEQLHVSKRVVPTGTVRLNKTVQTYETALDEPLAIRTYDIERIVLNQPVEAAPGIRQEGDSTIYPVVEEQAIITKQLILREEIRVTRRDTERRDQQTVTLRREHVEIERSAAGKDLADR